MPSRLARTLPAAPAVAARLSARSSTFVAALLLLAATVVAWSNTFSAPFVFDDHASIVDNATIRHLWPPAWLHPPATAGETVSGRPFLNFTFALNYAFGGLDVRGYHAVNLLIHFLAGLTLFGVVRRTRPGDAFALCIAFLWTLHPLQTAAVTYVVQRAESLAALLILFSLYCWIRSHGSTAARLWSILSILAAFVATLTKETAAIAPILILLYDRTFLAGSFRAAWQLRRRSYFVLFATWLPLAALVFANHHRGGSVAANSIIGSWTYLLTQSHAILRYLTLTVWPAHQVFDYGTPVITRLFPALPALLLILALLAATAWALRRNHSAGFLGAAFFLALAPSSSVVPIATQTIAEHRMYLALAAPIILLCAAVRGALTRSRSPLGEERGTQASPIGFRFRSPAPATTALAIAAILALGAATFVRNQVYCSPLILWQNTAIKRPDNPRAHHNLGIALLQSGRPTEAAAEFRAAIGLQPNHAYAHFQLGTIALGDRDWSGAAAHFESALAADPHYVSARINLAQALIQLGRTDDAIAHYELALADDPNAQDARTDFAAVLVTRHRLPEAITLLHEALAAAPRLAEAHYQLALALEQSGSLAAAEAELHEARRLKPSFAAAPLALGNLLARRGDVAAAEAAYRESLRLDPQNPETAYALGTLLAKQRRLEEAIASFNTTLVLAPAHLQARNNLANCQLLTGRLDEAIANYESVLRTHPTDDTARRNLELARELRVQRRTLRSH